MCPEFSQFRQQKCAVSFEISSVSDITVLNTLNITISDMNAANNVQGSNILDVLKKKMRATKEECEKFKEDAEDLQRKLQVEISRREEVSCPFTV